MAALCNSPSPATLISFTHSFLADQSIVTIRFTGHVCIFDNPFINYVALTFFLEFL